MSGAVITVPNTSTPAEYAAAITPSDTVAFGTPCRAIYIGTSGNLVAIVNGDAITFTGVVGGTILPIRATRVNTTNTTASNLVALY